MKIKDLPSATLRNNGDVELDLEAVFENPQVAAVKWLKQYAEERKRKEEADERQRSS